MSEESHIRFEDNRLFVGNQVIAFDYPVAQAFFLADKYFVRLEIPGGTDVLNENMFAVSKSGEIVWQIPEQELFNDDSPYTDLRVKDDLLVVYNWDGQEFTIDPNSYDIVKREFKRWG